MKASCDCGFSGTYTTPGRAQAALGRHSCDAQRAADAATARGRSKEAALDRTPRPCAHPRAAHQHGTRAAYVHDVCRCLACAAAASAYESARQRRVAYGRAAFVDAAPAVQHLRELAAAGVGWRRAAAAAGVAGSVVYRLLYGPAARAGQPLRARQSTVTAICAVPMPALRDLGGATIVSSLGTRRRLQALAALGWSPGRLAREHDLNRQALDRALAGQPVTVRTALAVTAAYEAIGDRPAATDTPAAAAGVARTRARAAAAGWAVPAAWDDDALDDPDGKPAQARTAGRVALDLQEWLHLVQSGESPSRAARRCGVTMSAVEQAAQRSGRRDVLTLTRT